MLNLKSQITYPLLPFSQLVFDMTRWGVGFYLFPVLIKWHDGAKEKKHIERAIRAALANHPVFQMRVDWLGNHYSSPLKDMFHGRFHDIALSVRGDDLIIQAQISRILGDGKSIEILLDDIRRAYEGLPLEPDNYWGYVARFEQHKTDPHYRISQYWLINEFANTSVPVRPTTDQKRLFTLLPPKPGIYKSDYTDLQAKIRNLSKKNFLSLDGLFSLCTSLAIAEYCGTDEAALTWAYEGRETPEEQRIVGSLHRDIPFKINHKSKTINHKSDLIRLARNQFRSGIAHSSYPLTLTKPHTHIWNFALNVLVQHTMQEKTIEIPFAFEPIETNATPNIAYSLLDVEIYDGETLLINFRYSATHYKESSIRRFAALVRKYVEWLVE
jgi:hypothetical protein